MGSRRSPKGRDKIEAWMNNIEKAIERMEKQEAACNKLISMAKRDLAEIYKRRKNARKLLEGFRILSDVDREDLRELIETTADQLVTREPVMISCMGVGIKC